jgi:hypothetical protein
MDPATAITLQSLVHMPPGELDAASATRLSA